MSLLAVRGISKRFGAVVALRSASLTIEPGEVHALLGANGAGKSTLVKVLTGVTRPDAGTIAVNGVAVRVAAPADAQRVGLAAVFQDPALIPDLTVRQNLLLTRIDVGVARQWLQAMDLSGIDLDDLTADLPLPVLRLLDLARALARNPQLLMLDEMTAALPADLAGRVFDIIRRWRAQGRSVLFISHRLVEVGAICDRATVLRDGSDVGTLALGHGSEGRIVDLMLGPAGPGADRAGDGREAPGGRGSQREVALGGPGGPARKGVRIETAGPLLEVKGLSLGSALTEVSFTVRAGEILGVIALEGQGQDVLFECLAGHRRATGGEIRVAGRRLAARTPYEAIRAGMVLVPADRLNALLPQRSVHENIALPLYTPPRRWGPLKMREERRRVAGAIAQLAIDTRAQRQVRRLSGGNQQKVTVARWLAAGFRVLLCFDPTRGIDLGTKRQLHALLRELAAGGAAIFLFTSELPEIPLVCDRVLVLYEGRVAHEMPAGLADESTLLRAAHGLTSVEPV